MRKKPTQLGGKCFVYRADRIGCEQRTCSTGLDEGDLNRLNAPYVDRSLSFARRFPARYEVRRTAVSSTCGFASVQHRGTTNRRGSDDSGRCPGQALVAPPQAAWSSQAGEQSRQDRCRWHRLPVLALFCKRRCLNPRSCGLLLAAWRVECSRWLCPPLRRLWFCATAITKSSATVGTCSAPPHGRHHLCAKLPGVPGPAIDGSATRKGRACWHLGADGAALPEILPQAGECSALPLSCCRAAYDPVGAVWWGRSFRLFYRADRVAACGPCRARPCPSSFWSCMVRTP